VSGARVASDEKAERTKKKLAFRSHLWQTAAIEMAIEWKYRGRIFNLADIESIRRLIAENPEASRWALSRKLCEAWDWKQANGALRDMVCRGLMLMLERAGEIELPRYAAIRRGSKRGPNR